MNVLQATLLDLALPARVRTSAAALLIANLLPVWGVLAWGWDVFTVLALYWAENVLLGVVNVLRMAVCAPHGIAGVFAKPFYMAFFCFHYGMFCFAHGAILYAIFHADAGHAGDAELLAIADHVLNDRALRGALALLALSHAYSYVTNFLVGGEHRHVKVDEQMIRPYGRIVILHVVILLGGFLATKLGSPMIALLLLAALKIWLDLKLHTREHRPRDAAADATPAST